MNGTPSLRTFTEYYVADLERNKPIEGEVAYYVDAVIYEAEYDDAGEKTQPGEEVARGSIKWDGCSNWTFNSHECMLHFCDRAPLEDLGKMLAQCWDKAATLIPETWHP